MPEAERVQLEKEEQDRAEAETRVRQARLAAVLADDRVRALTVQTAGDARLPLRSRRIAHKSVLAHDRRLLHRTGYHG